MAENQSTKALSKRRVRNIAVTTIILLVLLIAAGVGYTWYNDQKQPGQADSNTSSEVTEQTPIKPTQPSANVQESAAIEYLGSPVAPGDSTSVNVKTVATSACSISVIYNNVASTDPGLASKMADDFGNVSWDWTVGKSVPIGTWPVKITCARQGKSAVVQGDLQVR